jgi:excisionase family DNA binding protein
MAVLRYRKDKEVETQSRVLDVTASMEGSLVFQEPVHLRISGRFSGTLKTRGELIIGPQADVHADITGETIVIAGKVTGKVIAQNALSVVPPAMVKGEIVTPSLQVERGARIDGTVRMESPTSSEEWMTLQEVAEYLEVEPRLVEEWVREGRLPGIKQDGQWRFEKAKIDEWVSTQKNS